MSPIAVDTDRVRAQTQVLSLPGENLPFADDALHLRRSIGGAYKQRPRLVARRQAAVPLVAAVRESLARGPQPRGGTRP